MDLLAGFSDEEREEAAAPLRGGLLDELLNEHDDDDDRAHNLLDCFSEPEPDVAVAVDHAGAAAEGRLRAGARPAARQWAKAELRRHLVAAKMRSAKAKRARANIVTQQARMLSQYADNLRRRGRKVSLLNYIQKFGKMRHNLGLRLVIRQAGLATSGVAKKQLTFEQMLEASAAGSDSGCKWM